MLLHLRKTRKKTRWKFNLRVHGLLIGAEKGNPTAYMNNVMKELFKGKIRTEPVVGDSRRWLGGECLRCVLRGFVQRRALIIVRKVMLVKNVTGVH